MSLAWPFPASKSPAIRCAMAFAAAATLAAHSLDPAPSDHLPPSPVASAPLPPEPAPKAEWVFSLLPRSLQKDPRLDLTVITEMTEAGRQLPLVTPENPAYFAAVAAGYVQHGESVAERSLQQDDIERVLTRALATHGYRPANLPDRNSRSRRALGELGDLGGGLTPNGFFWLSVCSPLTSPAPARPPARHSARD